MDTRNILAARHRARGAVRPVLFIVIGVLAALAVGAWFLIIRPHQQLMQAERPAPVAARSAAAASTSVAAPAPVDVDAMSMEELLAQARKAINDQRYLAPGGNNAFEFYLRALQKQPGNAVATDALREIFPFASSSAEQAINQRNFSEAQRQIDLLAKADPTNYTLTILRSKLDAQKKTLDKEQQDKLELQRQQQLAQQKAALGRAAAEKASADQAVVEQQARLAAQQQTAQQAAAAKRQALAQTAPAATPAEGRGRPSASEAVKITTVNPRYPSQARRASQEGYVVVRFTVTPEGETSNVEVTSSEPRRVFDRAAIDAVERWRFKPATRNGKPVAATVTNRIDFKLGR